MFFGNYFSYLLFAAPVLILSLLAQAKVNGAYKKYSKIPNSRRITGAMAAQMILNHYGITDVRIEACAGKLSDHYSPNEKVIRLSQNVYSGASIAAVGVSISSSKKTASAKSGEAREDEE